MLKVFNVFGRVQVERDRVVITSNHFTEKGKGWPVTITEEIKTPEIPEGQTGEFIYALMVEDDKFDLYTHDIEPIEGVELAKLPIVLRHMELIAGSMKLFSKASAIQV